MTSPPAEAPIPGTRCVILYVEDQSAPRMVLSYSLRHKGYEVLEATDGPQALVLWQQHADQIALLITDFRMPKGMSGVDLVQRIRQDKPDLPVILTSGYLAGVEHASLPPGIICMAKPFTVQDLAAAVRSCLDLAGK